VVVQGATLVIRITGTMLMLSTMVSKMMIVDVTHPAALAEVGSNILLVLQRMLDVDADQRHDAGSLGQHEEPQQQGTKAP
jgi:hypothetical protein